MIISLFTLNNNNQPTFGYGLPRKVVSDIRDIPHLICPKCGDEMLSRQEVNSFISPVLEASSVNLQRPEFDKYRDTNVFRFLKNLSIKHPRKSIASITEDRKIQYKISKFNQDGQDTINEIIEISRHKTKNAPVVIKQLRTIKDKVPPEYQELLDYMEVYAMKYPDCTFNEIFNKPEVLEYHKRVNDFKQQQQHILQDKAFDKLDEIAKKLAPQDKETFINLNKTLKHNISSCSYRYYSTETRKKLMQYHYQDFLTKLDNKKFAAKVEKQLDILAPYSLNGDKLLLLMSRKDDGLIVKSIVDNLGSTFDHIHPESMGGTHGQYNGICLCKKCNRERGIIPYNILMEIHPNFGENVQKQLNKVMVFIKNGKLLNYNFYPQKVKKTLLEVTEQKLRINIKKYLKFKEKDAQLAVEKARAQLQRNNQALEQVNTEITENKLKINKLLAELTRLNKEQQKLNRQKAEKQKNILKSKTHLANKKYAYSKFHTALKHDK